MLLRSVTKHLKMQNWFAVFVDLLIVIFGVFIGLQVSNWNEEWAQDKRAKVLIERLVADLILDQKTLTELKAYQAIVKSYAIIAVDGFNNIESVTDEQFVISAYQASQVNLPSSYRATYTELINTGQIDLIKSNKLKTMILDYYVDDWAKRANMVYLAPYRENIRRAIPFAIQDKIRKQCGDISDLDLLTRATLPDKCSLSMKEDLIKTAAQSLRTQPNLLLDLQYQIAVYDTQVYNMNDYNRSANRLIHSIEISSALGKNLTR